MGPAYIALAFGVASSGPRPGAACYLSTDAATVAQEQAAPEDTPADRFPARQDSAEAVAAGASQPTLRKYAQLELGEALLAQKRFREAEEHLRAFIATHPSSPRLAKAHSSLARVLQQQNRAHDVLPLYLATIERSGDDPANRSIQSILLACARFHGEPADRITLQHELSTLSARARSAGQRTLAARCAWLLARIAKRSHPESTHQTFVGLARDVPPRLLPPPIAIEIAEHLVASDCQPEAEPLLRHLACRDGTPECPRALAALGLIAAERGDCGEALAIYEVFELQSARSALLPRILESHAEILVGQARHAEAIAILERLLGLPKLKDATAARTLCRVGEAHEALGQPEKAMPYYQRVHTMYAGHADSASRAYIASGRIFEKLKLWDSARRTYEELLSRDDLAAREECAMARERLQAIP